MLKMKLEGSPRERGRAHGEHFRASIRELAEIRNGLVRKYLKDLHPLELEQLAFDQVQNLSQVTPLFEEFCGIAEGAHLSLTELMILNNYTDMRDFGGHSKPGLAAEEGGCSAFSLRTADRVFIGQTWDMHASAKPYMLLLDVESNVPTQVLTVTGCLGLCGVNAYGLSVMINNLHCRETSLGLAWPALVRGMLHQENVEDALRFFDHHFPSSGHNYLVADRTRTVNLESTGQRREMTYDSQEEGFTFHTNHYLSDVLRSIEIEERLSPTTYQRLSALEAYRQKLSQLGPRQFDDLIEDIFLEKECHTVMMPGAGTPHASATCGGILTELRTGQGTAFAGFYSEGDHVQFELPHLDHKLI